MKKVILLFVLLSFVFKNTPLLAQTANIQDSLILFKFFSPPNKLSQWDAKKPVKAWNGITLDAFGRVKNLEVDYGFQGNLIKELGNLSELEVFSFKLSGLIGSIPAELGKLVNLKVFNIGFAYLDGEIPKEINQWTQLREFHLYSSGNIGSTNLKELGKLTEINNLSLIGNFKNFTTLPIEIGNLTKMKSFVISSSNVTSGVRNVVSKFNDLEKLEIFDCPQLADLNLYQFVFNSKNLQKLVLVNLPYVSGKLNANIGNCPQLNFLQLENLPLLTGSLPKEIGNNIALEVLILSDFPQVSGILPKEIGNLINLKGLTIKQLPQINGNFPQEISNLKFLFTVDISSTAQKNILVPLVNCTALWSINISRIDSIGTIPSSIGNLKNLTSLSISRGNISGRVPNSIGELKKLRTLEISRCNLKDTINLALANDKIDSLQTLNLSHNQLYGKLPKQLFEKKLLSTLSLNNNNLSGSINTNVSKPCPIVRLDLSHNSFTGNLPNISKNFQKIISISLVDNKISGKLTTDFTTNQRIQASIDSNLLVGPLDAVFFENYHGALKMSYNPINAKLPIMTKNNLLFTGLSASNCQLYGEIPSEINKLSNLSVLILNDNILTGSIPKSFGTLQELGFLHLYKNKLTGSLPKELGNLPGIYTILLNDNDLSGCYPESFSNLCNVTYYFFNNPKLPKNGEFHSFCQTGEGKCITSTQEKENQKINVSPNPFSENINIKLPNTANCNVELFDLQGKKLFSEAFLATDNIDIQCDFLNANAVYILKITTENGIFVKKIVKN